MILSKKFYLRMQLVGVVGLILTLIGCCVMSGEPIDTTDKPEPSLDKRIIEMEDF
jgi:hypothetical protein